MRTSNEIFAEYVLSFGYKAEPIDGKNRADFLVDTNPGTVCVELKMITPNDWWGRDPDNPEKHLPPLPGHDLPGGPLSVRRDGRPGFIEKASKQILKVVEIEPMPGLVVLHDPSPKIVSESGMVISGFKVGVHPLLEGDTHLSLSPIHIQCAMFGNPIKTGPKFQFPWEFRLTADSHQHVSAVAIFHEFQPTWRPATCALEIYHNPFARHPLSKKLFMGDFDSHWCWENPDDIYWESPIRCP